MNFEDLKISSDIKKSIVEMGFKKLTPIQQQTLPDSLKGKDILGQSQTGSGKTIAFSIPILEKLFIPDKSPQAIILCPTRELSIQIASQINKLGSNLKKFKVLPVYGGQAIGKQTRVLKKGVHIVVGTPGRVLDHIKRGNLDLIGVETLVLDEVDVMLDMGFRDDIEKILTYTLNKKQTLMFSATIPKEIKQIAKKYQNNPKFVKISDKKENLPDIEQYAFKCNFKDKVNGLTKLLDDNNRKLILIFCNTKKSVNFVYNRLRYNYSVDSIHGDMNQKNRIKVMNKFKNGNIKILVASDVAARGLDIDNINIIINFDVPQNANEYTHRIGRTARAGKSGMAFTLVSYDEVKRFKKIKNSIKTKIIEKQLPKNDNFDMKSRMVIKNDNFKDYKK